MAGYGMPQLGEIRLAKDIGLKGYYKRIWVACMDCGHERWATFSQTKSPAKRCQSCHLKLATKRLVELIKGKHSNGYKGGRTAEGYKLIYLHPDNFFYSMTNSNHYVMEHRLVMARHLGRCLHQWDIVHHKNHIRDDNRIENLQLISDDRHKQITVLEDRIKFLKSRVTNLEAEIVLLKSQSPSPILEG